VMGGGGSVLGKRKGAIGQEGDGRRRTVSMYSPFGAFLDMVVT
jgi:hypothetical protein